MSEIENGTLGLYGPEHSKCNHLMTMCFKGLKLGLSALQQLFGWANDIQSVTEWIIRA